MGRPRTTNLRDVFDAILYIAMTGCQRRMLPDDFPPVSTVRRYFYDWCDNDLLRKPSCKLVAAARQTERRETGPSAGVIDSQSAKTTVCAVPAPLISAVSRRWPSGESRSE